MQNIWSFKLIRRTHTVCMIGPGTYSWPIYRCMTSHCLCTLKEFDVIELVAFLSMANLAPATILSYILRVKYHLRIRFLNDFKDSFLLKLLVKGIVSQQCQPDVRLSITMDILVKMLHALPVLHINPHEMCMYRAVLVAGFLCTQGNSQSPSMYC